MSAELNLFSDEVIRLMPRFIRGMSFRQRDALGKGHITLPQYLALELLRSKGRMKMKEMADGMNISLPSATGLADRLLSLQLINREYDESDRRVVYLTLTSKGKNMIDGVKKVRRDAIKDLFGTLSRKEREAYLNIMKKLVRSLYGDSNET